MKRFWHALIVALGLWCSAAVAQQSGAEIKFEVPVVPEAARHLELLTVPAYLALALENNGLSPSLSSRLTIRNRESFQIKAGILRYNGRKGPIFNYEAGVKLSFGVGESDLTVRLEVDTSALARGAITLRVFSPFAKLFPQELIERIEFKIHSLADLQSQRKMVAYLDGIAKEHKDTKRGFEDMLEVIAFEAYNRSSGPGLAVTGGDRADSEPLSDQIVLLVSLAIWLVGFPLFLLFIRMRGKGQRHA